MRVLLPADILTITLTIGWLVVLEGLLSADNALVLAVMVRHLPKDEQKRALRYGIWGAFLFRLVAVIFASYLLQFWLLEVVGGLYLVFLAVRHFLSGPEEEADGSTIASYGKGFWGTVISVELADIAFSIDSILAAVGMVPEKFQKDRFLSLAIIYTGGILGIVMMRYVAGLFIKLLERFKGLASGAYVLVAWIGLKLIGSGVHRAFNDPKIPVGNWRESLPHWMLTFPWKMSDYVFYGGMATIVIASLLYRPRSNSPLVPDDCTEAIKEAFEDEKPV